MNPERWQRIEALFQSAVALSVTERSTYLAEACQGDEVLRGEVEALLAADQKADDVTLAMSAQVAAEMFAAPSSLESGQSLNHYTILSPLGAGGMGVVYLAEDTRLKRKVALKVLPIQFTRQPDRIRRFLQEAQAASALSHPNIVTIYEIGEVGAIHFLVTEFIDGQTLRAWLQSNEVALSAKLDIALQIASALVAAHEAGIIHRDIKPENVMVRPDGLVKVLDFGLAKLRRDEGLGMKDESEKDDFIHPSSLIPHPSTLPGIVMGTASYMSPEQARGEKVDVRTDIFSLGIVLYELVAGRMPFVGATIYETIAAILNQEPPPLVEVPPALQAMITKALQKERDNRYPNMREMQAELEHLQDDVKLQARWQGQPAMTTPQQTVAITHPHQQPTSSAEIILSEIKRNKRGVLATLAFVGLLLAGGAFGLYKWIGNKTASIQSSATTTKTTKITSFAGIETKPAFSPDGKQLAFTWGGEKDDNKDIYIRQIAGDGQLRLTTNPAIDSDPVWSPDGRQIAFMRLTAEDGAIYVMPSLGGIERKLTDISPLRPQYPFGSELTWAPDGKTLVFADREAPQEPLRLFSLTIETGERQTLTTPIPVSAGDFLPAFSPNGKTIAFARSHGGAGSLSILAVPATGGDPKQLTVVNQLVFAVAWAHDGNAVLYCKPFSVWQVSATGGTPEQVTAPEATVLGVATDPQQDRIAYIKGNLDIEIWRTDLQAKASDRGAAAKFIFSTALEFHPEYSPDGQKILFTSGRSGKFGLWRCDADGQNAVQLTQGDPSPSSPRWSPDGQQIVFDARPLSSDGKTFGKRDVYTILGDGTQRRQLTDNPNEDDMPSWSHDGKWIYFSSDRSGTTQIWKMPATGGEAIQITKQGGTDPNETWDGKAVIFVKGPQIPGLWRIDLATGQETLLTDVHRAGFWRFWKVARNGIYFATCESPLRSIVEFYDFATGKVSFVTKLPGTFPPSEIGLSLSPDGRWLMYSQEELHGDLMLMEKVR